MDYTTTMSWVNSVKKNLQHHQAIQDGIIEFFVLPSYPLIPEVRSIFADTRLKVGSQNLSSYETGAFTGEVSPKLLKQLGSEYAAIGHHERRTLFEENEKSIAEKVLAAFQNEIIPILCIGELEELGIEAAVTETVMDIEAGLELSKEFKNSPVVIAYEPRWAIGRKKPASSVRIMKITSSIKSVANRLGFTEVRVIYGGSAGPGLFQEVGKSIDGLFLGRLVHDPKKLVEVVDEIWSCINTQELLK